MNPLFRAINSLREQGLAATAAKLWGPVADRRFDRKYGVDTCLLAPLDGLTIESSNKEHGAPYQPTRVLPLVKMLRVLRDAALPDSVLMDFGSGKGRVLLLAAQQGFREVRGVEFAAELCEIARRNWVAFKARTATPAACRIIQADVTQYAVRPEENVFFLFNPFDEVILAKVFDNLAASLQTAPRRILVVFYFPHPRYNSVIDQRPEFALRRRYRFWGCDFSMYSNQA